MVNEFDKENKKSIQKMTLGGRIRYFLDYYFVKILIVSAVVIFFALLLISFLSPKNKTSLYVAVVDAQLDKEEKEELTQKLAKKIGCKSSAIHFDDKFSSHSADDMSSFDVLAANHAVDILIAPESVFENYAGQGYFISTDHLGWKVPDGKSMNFAGILEADPDDPEPEDQAGKGEKRPYGVNLSGSSVWEKLIDTDTNTDKDAVLGVISGTKHKKNAAVFFQELMYGN